MLAACLCHFIISGKGSVTWLNMLLRHCFLQWCHSLHTETSLFVAVTSRFECALSSTEALLPQLLFLKRSSPKPPTSIVPKVRWDPLIHACATTSFHEDTMPCDYISICYWITVSQSNVTVFVLSNYCFLKWNHSLPSSPSKSNPESAASKRSKV